MNMTDVLLYDVIKLAITALEGRGGAKAKQEALERLNIIKKALERVRKGK